MNHWMAALCVFFGLLAMLGGGMLALSSAGMNTTTTEFETVGYQTKEVQIYNIGLIGKQESGATAWGAVAIVGTVLFVGGWIVAGVQDVVNAMEADKKRKTKEPPAPYLPPFQEASPPPVRSAPIPRR
ncbi:MAG: hypothetical protein WCJ35_25775 [Planctomycetota bacterium]